MRIYKQVLSSQISIQSIFPYVITALTNLGSTKTLTVYGTFNKTKASKGKHTIMSSTAVNKLADGEDNFTENRKNIKDHVGNTMKPESGAACQKLFNNKLTYVLMGLIIKIYHTVLCQLH
jgi:hypothetical protein